MYVARMLGLIHSAVLVSPPFARVMSPRGAEGRAGSGRNGGSYMFVENINVARPGKPDFRDKSRNDWFSAVKMNKSV